LDAYKSVKMSSMARAFGMSVDLLDVELSRFIATGKVNAKVDKVGDVVVTNRPDAKNAQYQNTIKKGDHLLNQIQRLVRVLDI
jgi:26S proteasome regulatory subunit N7